MRRLIAFTFGIMVACQKEPLYPPPPDGIVEVIPLADAAPTLDESDAGDGELSKAGKACRNLRRIGCPEGERSKFGTPCVEYMEKLDGLVDVQCIVEAADKAALYRCSVYCTR